MSNKLWVTPPFTATASHMGKKYLQQCFDILSKALSTAAGFLWMRGVSVARHKELASLVVKCWTRWILLFWPHSPPCSPQSASTVTAKSHRNWADRSSNRLWSLWQESFNLPHSKKRSSPDKLQMALEPLIFPTLPQRCGFSSGLVWPAALSVWYSSKHGSCYSNFLPWQLHSLFNSENVQLLLISWSWCGVLLWLSPIFLGLVHRVGFIGKSFDKPVSSYSICALVNITAKDPPCSWSHSLSLASAWLSLSRPRLAEVDFIYILTVEIPAQHTKVKISAVAVEVYSYINRLNWIVRYEHWWEGLNYCCF